MQDFDRRSDCTLHVERGLGRQLKRLAVERERTLKELAERAIREFVDRERREGAVGA